MSSKPVFDQIAANVRADPSLVDKIKGVYQFNVGAEKWTVDLKAAPGSVKEGPAEKPDVTLTLPKAEDFLDMASGKLNGQQAFMQGKLKISGNMSFAMKLGTLFAARAPSAAGAAPAAPAAAPAPAAQDQFTMVFNEIDRNIKADPSLVKRVQGVYLFNVTLSSGQVRSWTVDLKNEPGKVTEGKGEQPGCTISLKEEDFADIMLGKVDGQSAFMAGKLKMTGNMALAMKLGQVLGSKVPKQAKL